MQAPLFSKKSFSAPFIQWNNKLINVSTFLHDVAIIARKLEDKPYVVNLCETRYYFLVAFAATLIKKQVTLLPQHQKPALLSQLKQNYPDNYHLTNDDIQRMLTTIEKNQTAINPIPLIESAQTVCIFFTSGSTGKPKAFEKTWGELVQRSRSVAAELDLDKEQHCLIATVPLQHLFGFEHMAMLGFQTRAVLHSAHPFYPHDIQDVLLKLKFSSYLIPYLISTPFHLNHFIQSKINMPTVKHILSSTAPLTKKLAQSIETSFQAKLKEIYGCTELGAIAIRRTATENVWRLIDDLKLTVKNETCFIENRQSEKSEELPDIIKQHSENTFSLIARKEDNINLAGKRSSKSHLTACLNEMDGVQDAAFYIPNDRTDVKKIIALVMAPTLSDQIIKKQLRQLIDNVFIPKKIIHVDTIPRSVLGKITQDELLKLIRLALWGAFNLGRRLLRIALYPICLYFMFFAKVSKKHAKKYLEKVFSKPITWRISFKHFYTFASVILDRVYFLKDQYDRFEIDVHGLEHIMATMNQGAILLGAHLGSFEALRALAIKHAIPLKVLMHMETSPMMTSYLHALNPKIAESVITMGNPDSILQAKDCLDAKAYIGILADRVYQNDKAVTQNFLGQDARFSTGPFRLSKLFKTPVIFFCGVYLGSNRYAIHFEKLEFTDDSPIEENLALYVQTLEKYVTQYPLNWFNFYDYWKMA